MGVVYKAEDVQLKRLVALKFLSRQLAGDEEVKHRLIREAQAVAALDHPHICAIHGIHDEDGETFLAMAFVDGPSLAAKIKQRPLRLDEALALAMQIGGALHHAHRKGVIHRDVKPHNVLLAPGGQAKVMDFGLALLSGRSKLTREGTSLGTLAYMAPEQIEGRPTDCRTDIWALGVTLYEMLTQRTPFDSHHEKATAYAILNEEPEPVSAQRSDIAPEIDHILAKALAKDPDDRYQHADEMIVDLRAAGRHSGHGHVGISATSKAAPAGRRRERFAWACALAAVLAVGVGIGTVWVGRETPRAPVYKFRQLTYDTGLTTAPAISPDGSLIAYASDRAGNGDLDIWVQQFGAAQAIRVTSDPADESEPNFSPDGRTIVFRSERDGSGIYTVPALGGQPRLLAPRGREPRYSPKGDWVAYWVGDPSGDRSGAKSSTAYLVPAAGGEPKALVPDWLNSQAPIWAPDGSKLLFAGYRSFPDGRRGFWLVNTDGSDPVFAEINARWEGWPAAWLPGGELILGDLTKLSSCKLSPETGKILSPIRTLTTGPRESYLSPSMRPDGTIVVATTRTQPDIWNLPLDADQGKPAGPLQPISNDLTDKLTPSVSLDGRRVLYLSARNSVNELLVFDTRTQELHSLNTASNVVSDFSVSFISRDGERAYVRFGRDRFRIDLKTGTPVRIPLSTPGILYDSLNDGSGVLFSGRTGEVPTYSVSLHEFDGDRETLILSDETTNIYWPKFSPDDRWIAFKIGGQRVEEAPFRGTQRISRSECIEIASGYKPVWSPGGEILYFLSERDGKSCVWAQRVDAVTKRPTGPDWGVLHLHDARRSLANIGKRLTNFGIARDRLVINMGETTGNIWALEPEKE